jgi:16S rRNA (uracil1498-N3)-methyltransferase
VPGAAGDRIVLPEVEAHHVIHVLRLCEGADVTVFDGRGREWRGRIHAVTRREVSVDLIETQTPLSEPSVVVTLAVGLLKGDQMSSVIRDATALGVGAIAPFVSSHVALPEDAWRTRAIDRWARIASSSAAQCGRAVVPAIHDVVRFEEVLGEATRGAKVMCVEPGAGELVELPGGGPSTGTAVVFVGPEGGWSADEIAAAAESGAYGLNLGPRTLRAELAPAVALAVLWERWHERVR